MTYRCTHAFAVGNPSFVYSAGQLIADNDKILKTHKAFFELVEETVQRTASVPQSVTAAGLVETASRAPDELRTTTTGERLKRSLKGGSTA